MKANENLLTYIFLCLLLLISVINLTYNDSNNDSLEFLKTKSKSLETEISVLRNENEKLEGELLKYQTILNEIDSLVGANNNKIDKIKIQGNEKINSFKSFSALEWERYFTERYETKRAKGHR
jgi:hypothetical protein